MNPITRVASLARSLPPALIVASARPHSELPTESFEGTLLAERPTAPAAAPPPAAPAAAPPPAAAASSTPPPREAVPVALVEFTEAPARLPRVYPGYDRSYLDPTVRPQEDFYHYAVGGYIKAHPIPPDKQSYGVRTELYERVDNVLHDICEAAARQNARPGTIEQKIGDFYASAMDTKTMDLSGLEPLRTVLDRIQGMQSADDVPRTIGWLHANGFSGAFSFGATQDVKNPEMMIGEADQAGLGLPGKEYYLSDAADKREIRAAYLDHVSKMFAIMGDEPETARAEAQTVLSLETEIARGSKTRAERRDPAALYNMMDRARLAELTPHFSWDRYFADLGQDDIQSINVATPDFFRNLDGLLSGRPVGDWKTYLRWTVLNRNASYLSEPFREQNFAFKGGVLSGIQQQPERWKIATGLTDDFLGEAVGQKFVQKTFPPEAKQRARAMVLNIRDVMRDKIVGLGWMSEASKKEALAKIDRLNVKIGYPDQWKDYSALEIDRGPLLGNVLRANEFANRQNLSTIGKTVDRSVWEMTPATINAYYHPTLNEIVFPAARLLPPFFDPDADDATNYGATGATIAHELTHGFDDSGAQFDSRGVMRDWWSPEDKSRFDKIADGVIAQMSEFTYDGQREDGKLVAGEAMADLGGVEIAYEALQRALATQPAPWTNDGFTPQQRFFLSYTLCRQSAETPKAAHLQMSTDPHPLAQFRVNGPLANMPAFHEAFQCRSDDPMVRPADKRNTLWNA